VAAATFKVQLFRQPKFVLRVGQEANSSLFGAFSSHQSCWLHDSALVFI
jgi:hypothetical protein